MRNESPESMLLWALMEGAAKGAVLLAAAWGVTRLLRRSSAAARHWVWFLATLGALVLPLLSVLLPGWRVLPGWAASEAGAGWARTVDARTAGDPGVAGDVRLPRPSAVATPATGRTHSAAVAAAPKGAGSPPPATESGEVGAGARAVASAPVKPLDVASITGRVRSWVGFVWLAGFAAMISRWLLGRVAVCRLARSARVVSEGPLAERFSRCAAELRIRRTVLLLQGERLAVRMTWGVFVPRVLLPAAADEWTPARQELALLHELAHVRRWDSAGQLIGFLACAVYWFNPLAWVGARSLSREQEYAADDLVLSLRAPASAYAQLLLDVAVHACRGGAFGPSGVIAMARVGAVERRVRAILDGARQRAPLTGRVVVWGLLSMVAVIVPVAALRAGGAPAPSAKTPAYAGRLLTPDGKPARGGEVFLMDLTKPAESQRVAVTKVAADGKFAFDSVPPSDESRGMTFVGYADGTAPMASTAFAGEVAENEFSLMRASSVRVTFVDPDGKPVPGLRVTPTMAIASGPAGAGFMTIQFPPELAAKFARTTDASGACTIDDMPRRWGVRLEMNDPRFARLGYLDDLQLADAASSPAATVKLRRGGSISGTVRYGPGGKPAAGIEIVAQSVNSGGPGWGRAVTNQDGAYRMEQIPSGVYNVAANLNDDRERAWAVAALERVRLGDGEQLGGQDLALVKGGLLRGRVLRADTGRGVAGVRVGLHGPDHPRSGAMIGVVVTDAEGVFATRVAPGEQYVYLSDFPPDGYVRPPAEEVTLATGQTQSVEIKLPRRPGKPVAGRVVGEDGRPVAGARVLASIKSDRPNDTLLQTTDAAGRFQFKAVGPGTRLRAARGSKSTQRAVVVNGGEQDLLLKVSKRMPHAISGLVTDTAGKPIAGARVEVITREGTYGTGMGKPELTDAEGRYTIEGLSSDGDYSVSAEADGYGQGGDPVTLDLERKTTQVKPLKLERFTARIGGRVVDVSGKPVAGVKVEVNGAGNGYRSTVTDAEGRFSFEVLDGSVPLVFLRDAYGVPRGTLAVRAGDVQILLTLPMP